ncbi:hypothetical protein E4S40_11970 [Algoriphagus kandeliae]|uniref:Uncharacterized protein n=1 Tax=Algoriphagus kandeliae TaxID=2562278 RepID=A0A4Y9QQ31_9BACT|nr:hypothetical protein [Algoriphagus kandeliae]TFV94719.1 hypothetical protein E4S40_11970 [Algoriphagus kandeliae]
MNNKNLVSILAAFLILSPICACSEKDGLLKTNKNLIEKENQVFIKEIEKLEGRELLNQESNPSENIVVDSLQFLKDLNEKYPYDVKLFENSAFTERLKNLLGPERFTFLIETWAVEMPIEYDNELFIAQACQKNNCDTTNFIILYDTSKMIMHVGIRENDEAKIYSEEGDAPQLLKDWANNN